MTNEQLAMDEAYVRDVLQRMQADLARHVEAIRAAGHPEVAAHLLLNFHAWGLTIELRRRISTPSGQAQFESILAVLREAVAAAAQGYPDPTRPMTH